MLQRTRADLVVTIYEEVLTSYSSAAALADAPSDTLAALLRPLGYTHRNVRVQAAAHACRFGVPATLRDLLEIPGVGAYAAAATLCFGFDRRLAVVDPNIIRVLARLGVASSTTARPRADPGIWRAAQAMLPARSAREWNLGLIDLGATICRPKPRCNECPLLRYCPTGGERVVG